MMEPTAARLARGIVGERLSLAAELEVDADIESAQRTRREPTLRARRRDAGRWIFQAGRLPGSWLAAGSSMAFRKILCPVDFSESSNEALRVAAELVGDSRGSLTLLHAWDISAYAAMGDAAVVPSMLSDMGTSGARLLAEGKQRAIDLGAPKVTSKLVQGPPWSQIVETLEHDPSFDLVVLGTHGRSGLKRVLIGSVAERVARHAPCPVLVVRQRETPEK